MGIIQNILQSTSSKNPLVQVMILNWRSFHRLGLNKKGLFNATPNGEMILNWRSFHCLRSNKKGLFNATPNGEMKSKS